MVVVAGFGGVAGAVYKPVASIAPFALPPVTAHVTVWSVAPMTWAANCIWVAAVGHAFPATLANKFALMGMTVTVTVGGGEGPPLEPPPQASISPSIASETHRPAKAECLDTFRPASPASSPATGNVSGSHGHGDRLSARCRIAAPVPVFGPFVVMVNETAVVPDPVAIFVGSACPVLNTQTVVGSGSPEQTNVTSPANVVAPLAGVAVKL
jgi:hypothetical protein